MPSVEMEVPPRPSGDWHTPCSLIGTDATSINELLWLVLRVMVYGAALCQSGGTPAMRDEDPNATSVPRVSWRRAMLSRVVTWLGIRLPTVYGALASGLVARNSTAAIPWTPLPKPLAECRVALLTTGGVHRCADRPFDVNRRGGDCSYRMIPDHTAPGDLQVTHLFYDHRDVDADPEVMFPLAALHALTAAKRIGRVSPRHFSFNGNITHVQPLVHRYAPAVAPSVIPWDVPTGQISANWCWQRACGCWKRPAARGPW